MTGLERRFEKVSKVFFLLSALLFLALALTLMGIALYRLAEAVLAGHDLLHQTLESVGLLIIGVAVFEVAKFLVEEEVLRDRELRSIAEARLSLTKFLTILVIALALEGIVVVFETKLDRVELLLYPTALLAVAVLAAVGLGLFRWLTNEDRDERNGGARADALEARVEAEEAIEQAHLARHEADEAGHEAHETAAPVRSR